VKFGVLQFPGSCDEVDALHAARRVGDAELIWHGERDLKGADAIVVPGGFSYGDYLRAGAIARFCAGDGVGDRLRARRRAGAGDLQRLSGAVRGGHLLPGALLGNANRRFTFRQVELEV
jgi:phosphoribosylformylglycinamidine (FGAM) synthase-like amidotransferase family enzyme